jgi:hypothetical protein
MLWAAPQDWMCEPIVINGGTAGGQRFAGTHLSVAEHQRRTVANYAQLRDLAPDLPIIPVVQGWSDSARSAADKAPGTPGTSCAPFTYAACVGCMASGSKPSAWPNTATCSPQRTPWPGPSTPDAAHHYPATTPDTATAPTA